MASIINASSTGSGGIVQTADASGVLQLQSNGSVVVAINSATQVSIATANTGGALTTSTTAGNWGVLIYDGTNNASMLQFRNNVGSAAGNISLSSAGATSILISSVAGVNFPATQVASADANTLDDYEEGTFTPSYSGGLTGVSYGSVRSGYYRKIGSQVTIWFGIMTSGLTVTASGLTVSGLPFTATNSGGSNGTLNINNGTRWSSSPPTTGTVEPNTTTIILYNNIGSLGSGDDPVQVVTSNMETGGSNQNILFATATYIATA